MTDDRPDFSPTAVDVVLRPEWAAKEGADKEFIVENTALAAGDATQLDYTVPVGKTLVITDVSYHLGATDLANGELNQICRCRITEVIALETKWVEGGNGGGHHALRKPLIFLAGEQFRIGVRNMSNHTCVAGSFAAGYEY